MSSTQPRLTGKIFIEGKIVTETGLHIGGSKDGLDIGGVDLNVIKTYDGRPFIPGSSLKGKLRSMLSRIEGTETIANRKGEKNPVRADEHVKYLRTIFGLAGEEDESTQELTRLIVRDAYLDVSASPNQDEYDEMDFKYTDVKFENSIDRKRGVAQHPRQLERVPAGATFDFQLILDVYDVDEAAYTPIDDQTDELKVAPESTSARDHYLNALSISMRLLEDDYLGGHGTRGYGKIAFQKVNVRQKVLKKYEYLELAEVEAPVKAFAAKFSAA